MEGILSIHERSGSKQAAKVDLPGCTGPSWDSDTVKPGTPSPGDSAQLDPTAAVRRGGRRRESGGLFGARLGALIERIRAHIQAVPTEDGPSASLDDGGLPRVAVVLGVFLLTLAAGCSRPPASAAAQMAACRAMCAPLRVDAWMADHLAPDGRDLGPVCVCVEPGIGGAP